MQPAPPCCIYRSLESHSTSPWHYVIVTWLQIDLHSSLSISDQRNSLVEDKFVIHLVSHKDAHSKTHVGSSQDSVLCPKIILVDGHDEMLLLINFKLIVEARFHYTVILTHLLLFKESAGQKLPIELE